MLVAFAFLILSFIGTLSADQPDIDINRIKLLAKDSIDGTEFQSPTFHNRRSIVTRNYRRRNDYDHHSSRGTKLRAPMQFLQVTSPSSEPKTNKVHQPREDPRLFYQSDAYTKENNGQNLNNEVSAIYLGREEVRGEVNYRSLPIRRGYNELNSISEDQCVRCPHDRTLIAKPGLDRALLVYPHLTTCAGLKAPRDAHFVHMYGPEFGSLLKEGSHVVIGRIDYRGETLQTCKLQIHVLIQTCPVPKYLISHCGENKTCSFTCRNPKAEIRGRTTLVCGHDKRWLGRLPACTVRAWCSPPPPPDHGKLVCQGSTAPNGWGLAEGSRCRAECAQGWQWSPRGAAICRRGLWTRELRCRATRAT